MVLFSSSVYAFARGHNHNVSCINALPYYKSLLLEALCVVTSLGLADPSLFHASFYSYFIFISLCSGFSTKGKGLCSICLCIHKPEFLNLKTIDSLGWIILCCGGLSYILQNVQ